MPGKRSSKDGNVAIYVFWSEKRTLDTNTISYLQELLDVAELVLFVSNSPLDPLDVSKIKALGVSFLQRENLGFDFWGWKEGIERLENKIKNANNLILCNSSCFLAFNSLASLFLRMDGESDIWGISSFEAEEVPYHLQSYFLVFKKTALEQWDSFISFWINLPKMPYWRTAVDLGELRLTKFYLNKGFKCKAIVNPSSLPSRDVNPSFYYPVELFRQGAPFLKKKIFLEDYSEALRNSYGAAASLAMEYVKEQGGRYGEILSELIERCSPTHLTLTLHLNYFINVRDEEVNSLNKTAVICFVYYEDMVQYMSDILMRFTNLCDVFIVSSKIELLESYKNKLPLKGPKIECRLQENRGRNEAAYFITCKDVWQNYEYICALHDKKSSHVKPSSVGVDFMKHCEKNLCPSKNSIKEVIKLFEANPLLGLLVPPAPFFGNFIFAAYNPIGRNLRSITLLNNSIFSKKIFSSNKEIDVACAPFGGMFWARSKALSLLSQSSISFDNFPTEPLKSTDGTILHAIERCYPMIAKTEGYYTARLTNIALQSILFDNLTYLTLRLSLKERILFLTRLALKKAFANHSLLYNIAKNCQRKIFNLKQRAKSKKSK